MPVYDGNPDPGARRQPSGRQRAQDGDAAAPQDDTPAGQEGDRAGAALDNQREGYGGPSGGRGAREQPEADSAREVARRHGEKDR